MATVRYLVPDICFPQEKKYSTYANLFMESARKIFAAYFHIFIFVELYYGYVIWRG